MLFVLAANSVDLVIILVYILHEGITTGYDVTEESSKEKLFSIDGAS